jgi:hypothetical protein
MRLAWIAEISSKCFMNFRDLRSLGSGVDCYPAALLVIWFLEFRLIPRESHYE